MNANNEWDEQKWMQMKNEGCNATGMVKGETSQNPIIYQNVIYL